MSEHYDADPARGCGIMIVGGVVASIAVVILVAFLAIRWTFPR